MFKNVLICTTTIFLMSTGVFAMDTNNPRNVDGWMDDITEIITALPPIVNIISSSITSCIEGCKNDKNQQIETNSINEVDIPVNIVGI